MGGRERESQSIVFMTAPKHIIIFPVAHPYQSHVLLPQEVRPPALKGRRELPVGPVPKAPGTHLSLVTGILRDIEAEENQEFRV
jgi:hypothetical protein